MWTKRFVALPINVFNVEQENLTGKADMVPTFLNVNPFDITAYRVTFDGDQERTYIELKNGSGYMITMTVQEFEETMNLLTQSTN